MNHGVYIHRRENRLTQSDVAKKLNINKTTYHLKKTGKSDFTITEAKRMAILYKCTLDDLFGGVEV